MKNQNQKVNEDSTAIQAGNDVNINVNDYNQIKSIFNDLFELNFPRLVNEAQEQATGNIQEYLNNFMSKINKENKEKVQENLKKPKNQYILNTSIQYAGRYGNDIDLDLLSKTVFKILLDDNEFANIILNQVVEVLPKLSKDHIKLIVLLFYFTQMGLKNNMVNIQSIENLSQIILRIITTEPKSNNAIRMHLVGLGVFTFNQFSGGTAVDLLEKRYGELIKELKDKKELERKLPITNKLILYFGKNTLIQHNLTPIGSSIAVLTIQNYIPDIDINDWLK